MTRKSKVIKSIQKHLFCMLMICLTSFQSGDWGGIPNNQLKQIYITQKKCIKILFGDYENYVDKFKTCARARPMNSQHLGSEFDVKESTKPLFTKRELLAIDNLYKVYMYCCLK